MTDKNVSIRIGVTGKEDVKRAFDEVGNAGKGAFDKTAAAMDSAGAAIDRQTQRLQRLAQAAKQSATADAAQRNFNAFMGITSDPRGAVAKQSAKVIEDAAKATEALEARTKALRAQIDPLGAAQARLNAELAEATSLFKQGAISEQEMSAAHALAQARFNASSKAIKSMGDNTRLAGYAITNLGFQLNDVVVGLASGQKPLTVLVQQGTQIAQVFAGSGLGVGGVLKELGRTVASLISPTTALVGVTAAVGATAVLAYNSYITSQKELETATAGVGRAAGATIDQLNRIADTASEAGRVSVASAREMETAFLRAGNIGVDQFGDLIAIAKNYAATTGEDVETAVKELATAFADPAKGVDLLNAKVGGYDDRTRQLIKTLAAQNDIAGAQALLLKNLRPSLIDASESTNALGRAWDYVARTASNAYDALGRAIDRATDPSLADRLADLQQERSQAVTAGGHFAPTFGGTPVFVPSRPLSAIDADIENVKRQLAAVSQKASDAKEDALAARTSVLAGDIARSVTPGFSALETLKNQQSTLGTALNDPATRQKVADLKQVEAAYDAVTRAVTTWLDPAEKARQLDELEVRALQAKTPAQKAAIAAERARIQLSGQAVTTATAEAEINRAGEKARAEAIRSIREQSLALATDTRSSLELADAYLTSASAALQADARRKALTESIRNGVDVQTRMNELLRDEIAQTAAQGARQASDISAQADAQHRLNDAVASGAITVEQAQRQMRVEQQLRPLIVAQSLAEGDAKATLTRIIDALRAAYGRLNAEESRGAAQQQLAAQKDQVMLLQKQIELAGTNQSQAAVEIAQLQAKQQLLSQGISATSAEGQAIIGNAAAIERLNQQLALARSSTQELQSIADSTFSHFSDLISQGKLDWKSWADAGRAAIADITNEILKLAVLNPLKNALFGSNLPTFGSVGGIIGGLLHGGGAGSFIDAGTSIAALPIGHTGGMAEQLTGRRPVPISALRYAPRFHGGGFLSPDEVPAVLLRGERVLDRAETRRYNARESRQPIFNFNFETPNPAAFKASKSQIAASLTRAVQAGMRGL